MVFVVTKAPSHKHLHVWDSTGAAEVSTKKKQYGFAELARTMDHPQKVLGLYVRGAVLKWDVVQSRNTGLLHISAFQHKKYQTVYRKL